VRRRLACAVLMFLFLVATACSSSDSASTGDGQQSASATPTNAQISLPDGWAMQDAISAEEVAAVTGQTMTYFPEAGSSAQAGKPSCGYTVAGKDDSKILFSADVSGGSGPFEAMKDYAVEGTIQSVDGLGDAAYTCAFAGGRRGIIVLKGNALVRVDWSSTAYTVDTEEFGTALAGKLLANLFR